MLLLLSSAAFAVVPPQTEAEVADFSELGITAEVISVECLSYSEDGNGVLTQQYVAELEVLEVLKGDLNELSISAAYSTYEYPSDAEMPSCASTGVNHPVGEIANYYFSGTADGQYLLGEYSYFESEDSQPGEATICPDLPEADPEPADEEADPEVKEESTGCAGGGLSLLLVAMGLRRRKR